MKSDDERQLQRDLAGLDQPTPDDTFVEGLRNRLQAAHARRRPRGLRWPQRLLPWTAGGALAAAVLLTATLWLSSDMGFADVQQSLRNVTTAQFQARFVVDRTDGWPDDMLLLNVWFDVYAGARSRADLLGQPVLETITRWDDQVWVINHLRGQTTSWSHGQEVDRWVRELDPATLIRQLRDTPGVVAHEREPQTLYGQRTRHFELTGEALDLQPGASLDLWVDARTSLPLRVEFTLPEAPQGRLRLVVDDFQWNESMPVEWFLPPATMEQVDSLEALLPEVNTVSVIDTLRRFSDRTGGYYPGHAMAEPMLALLMMQLHAGPQTSREDVALLEDLLAAGVFLVEQVRRGAEPVYAGRSINARDADEPLLTWTPAPGQQRVVYGDLRVETIDEAGDEGASATVHID
ncbi:hypothetical protein ACERK3_14080 [Phycisphaerales bacterium AB-hyl4]|uniref:DUF4179 domain-containing protein n=1 Tax=Natronomicrosphaera hydrolytica TaxID=3242702 RepID=A0ABV4U9D5_9BACT